MHGAANKMVEAARKSIPPARTGMSPTRSATIDIAKLSTALPATLGKVLHRVFMADHGGERYQLVLVFADGTSYELYGVGSLSGARDVEPADEVEIRRRLSLSIATVAEVGRVRVGADGAQLPLL